MCKSPDLEVTKACVVACLPELEVANGILLPLHESSSAQHLHKVDCGVLFYGQWHTPAISLGVCWIFSAYISHGIRITAKYLYIY